MAVHTLDFIVIGAGIAGISAAYELAGVGKVAVLDQEQHAAYHSTGRSAAIFVESYGGAQVRALSRASHPFLEAPELPSSEGSLLKHRRGLLYIAQKSQESLLEDRERYDTKSLRRMELADILELVPVLDANVVSTGLFDQTAADLDVHALHQLYARGLKARGGQLHAGAKVERLARSGDVWHVATDSLQLQAPVIVNAAGAWAAEIGRLMGASDYGLVPYLRSAALIDPPTADAGAWPMVVDAAETVYFKPDAGRLMLSPADETPTAPCDAMPDDLDIAVAVDRFESLTTVSVKRVSHSWAGLRTFAPDRVPIIGFDPDVAGLFWLAGQGGVGVQTAPAAARLTAALASKASVPADLLAAGITGATYSPQRSTLSKVTP